MLLGIWTALDCNVVDNSVLKSEQNTIFGCVPTKNAMDIGWFLGALRHCRARSGADVRSHPDLWLPVQPWLYAIV